MPSLAAASACSCVGLEDSALEGTAGSVGPSIAASQSPALVLDTPSTFGARAPE